MVSNESPLTESDGLHLVSMYDIKSESRTCYLIDKQIGKGLVLEAYTIYDNVVDPADRIVFGYSEVNNCQEIIIRKNNCHSVFFKKLRKLNDSYTAIETWKCDSPYEKPYLFETAIIEMVHVYEPIGSRVVRLKILYEFRRDQEVSSIKKFYFEKDNPRKLILIKEFDVRYPFVFLNFIRWNGYRLMENLFSFKNKVLYLPFVWRVYRKMEVDNLPNKIRNRSLSTVRWLPEENFIIHETIDKYPFFARIIERYSYSL